MSQDWKYIDLFCLHVSQQQSHHVVEMLIQVSGGRYSKKNTLQGNQYQVEVKIWRMMLFKNLHRV